MYTGNFALWGIYFFVLLVAEKVFLLKEMEHIWINEVFRKCKTKHLPQADCHI